MILLPEKSPFIILSSSGSDWPHVRLVLIYSAFDNQI